MEYTIKLIEIEITRLETRLENERTYLEASIKKVQDMNESISWYEERIAELVTALSKIEAVND